MTKTTHILIIDRTTGDTLAKLPLTFPIGETVERFIQAGHTNIHWTWLSVDWMPEPCGRFWLHPILPTMRRRTGTNSMRIKTDPTKTLSNGEKAVINHALIRLREVHWNNYARHSKPQGDVAQHSKRLAEQIDQLRGKVLELWEQKKLSAPFATTTLYHAERVMKDSRMLNYDHLHRMRTRIRQREKRLLPQLWLRQIPSSRKRKTCVSKSHSPFRKRSLLSYSWVD